MEYLQSSTLNTLQELFGKTETWDVVEYYAYHCNGFMTHVNANFDDIFG